MTQFELSFVVCTQKCALNRVVWFVYEECKYQIIIMSISRCFRLKSPLNFFLTINRKKREKSPTTIVHNKCE